MEGLALSPACIQLKGGSGSVERLMRARGLKTEGCLS